MEVALNSSPIGIFDSGLGGLTVASEIMKLLPSETLIYVGDTARFPYGTKPAESVRRYANEIIAYLTSRRVKIIVIACNTATAAVLEEAQTRFPVPIIGVIEPGARAAALATRNRRVGVIGTAGTIASGAYSRAVRAVDAGVTVFSAACPKFVEIVERGGFSEANVYGSGTYMVAKGYLKPLLEAGIDTLVLGCTHYPLLSDLLRRTCGPKVTLINSAQETARQVAEILHRRSHLSKSLASPRHEFIVTGSPKRLGETGVEALWRRNSKEEYAGKRFRELGSRFLGRDIGQVSRVALAPERIT